MLSNGNVTLFDVEAMHVLDHRNTPTTSCISGAFIHVLSSSNNAFDVFCPRMEPPPMSFPQGYLQQYSITGSGDLLLNWSEKLRLSSTAFGFVNDSLLYTASMASNGGNFSGVQVTFNSGNGSFLETVVDPHLIPNNCVLVYGESVVSSGGDFVVIQAQCKPPSMVFSLTPFRLRYGLPGNAGWSVALVDAMHGFLFQKSYGSTETNLQVIPFNFSSGQAMGPSVNVHLPPYILTMGTYYNVPAVTTFENIFFAVQTASSWSVLLCQLPFNSSSFQPQDSELSCVVYAIDSQDGLALVGSNGDYVFAFTNYITLRYNVN